jgi:hypothetical protein
VYVLLPHPARSLRFSKLIGSSFLFLLFLFCFAGEGFTPINTKGKADFPGAQRTFSFGGAVTLTEQLDYVLNTPFVLFLHLPPPPLPEASTWLKLTGSVLILDIAVTTSSESGTVSAARPPTPFPSTLKHLARKLPAGQSITSSPLLAAER